MQFSTMYGEVEEYVPDATLSTAKAKELVNRAYLELAMSFQFRELDFEDDISTVSGQNFQTLPGGARDIISVYDEDDKFMLRPETIEWYEGRDNSDDATGVPEYYVIWQTKMLFWPTPDVVHTLRVRYRKLPDELSADADEPVYPEEWHEVIVLMAASKACLIKGYDSKMINLKNAALQKIEGLQEDKTMLARRRVGQITVQRTRAPVNRARERSAEWL